MSLCKVADTLCLFKSKPISNHSHGPARYFCGVVQWRCLSAYSKRVYEYSRAYVAHVAHGGYSFLPDMSKTARAQAMIKSSDG